MKIIRLPIIIFIFLAIGVPLNAQTYEATIEQSISGGFLDVSLFLRHTGTTSPILGNCSFYVSFNNSVLSTATLQSDGQWDDTYHTDYGQNMVNKSQEQGLASIEVVKGGTPTYQIPDVKTHLGTIRFTITDTSQNSEIQWNTSWTEVYDVNNADIKGDGTFTNPGNQSLPVELSSFTATGSAAGMELEWTTQTETNNIGFYIYRSETKEGEYTRVNKNIIDGAGNSAMPHTYKYIDGSVDPDVDTYFYYLEDVDIAGIKNKSQMIKATQRKISKFTAEYHKNSVSLKWSVEPQLYIPAWNVYRSTNENGVYVKLDEPKFEFDDETHTYGYAESFSNEYLYRHPGEHLYYYVEGMDSEGRPLIKSRTFKVKVIPESFALFQNYPNPYNPETWIPYQLPVDAIVTINIYNVTGHLVKTFSLGEKRTGIYISKNRAAYWNGRNEAGERVSSGLYFYAIEAGNFRGIKRMLLVK